VTDMSSRLNKSMKLSSYVLVDTSMGWKGLKLIDFDNMQDKL